MRELSNVNGTAFRWQRLLQKASALSDLNKRLDALLGAGISAPISDAQLEDIEQWRLKAQHALSPERREHLGPLNALEEKISQFSGRLATINLRAVEFSTALTGLLQREKDAFDNAAKTAAQLAEEIKSLQPAQRTQLRPVIDQLLAKAFDSAAGPAGTPLAAGPPTRAPELWSKRAENAGETAFVFLQRVYAPWLESMNISNISELDRALYLALQQWLKRHKSPPSLKTFFARQRRTGAEVEAELKKHNIKKPEDAYARFPDDKKTANRLYSAAKARR